MKFPIFLATVLVGLTANAASLPMNLVEKASYRLTAMVQKGQVPSYMSTDLSSVTMTKKVLADGSTGTEVVLFSPSNNSADENALSIEFSADGKILNAAAHIVGQGPSNPVFNQLDGAKLLDLAAEAIVDHLDEDALLPVVAEKADRIEISNTGKAVFAIHLNDGRVYTVVLGLNGDFLTRGL